MGFAQKGGTIFDSTDVSFDLGDVLILSTQIKADVPKHVLQWHKFEVSIHDGDLETPSTIYFSHRVKACSHSADTTVEQIFDGPKM
jgi:hypothetical protein